jgi:hypothetical protein
MAHVSLASGQTLRLRLFPKPKATTRGRRAAPTSLSLFDAPVTDDSADTPVDRLAVKIGGLCLLNRNNTTIVDRFSSLGIRDWWLTSGCLFQTVWNLRMGRPADRGILDYDVFYFSEDISWEAEDEVIRNAATLFADLPVKVQVRNQARVHLWYPEKFGIAYPPLTTAAEGILRFPCGASAIGMKRTGEGFLDLYAPFGLGDLWEMVARPNRALPLANIYAQKTARWLSEWPQLTVFPWGDAELPA